MAQTAEQTMGTRVCPKETRTCPMVTRTSSCGYPNRPDGYPNWPDGYPNRPDGFPNKPDWHPNRPDESEQARRVPEQDRWAPGPARRTYLVFGGADDVGAAVQPELALIAGLVEHELANRRAGFDVNVELADVLAHHVVEEVQAFPLGRGVLGTH